MKSKVLFMFAAILAAFVITSCSKLPQAEIDQANMAIDSAKLAGADLYVPELYLGLQDSMKSVMEGVEAQKSKLFKNYGTSKEKLAAIVAGAKDAAVQAGVKKEEMKIQIQNTIAEVNTLVSEDKELMKKAPKGKEGATALAAMKDELTNIEASVAEAQTLFDQGDYIASNDKVKVAKDQATTINTELKDAIAKVKK